MVSRPIRVLFLCTGNSCRSQMAQGWLHHLGREQWAAFSAGTNPVGLNPLAVTVMAERGVDISRQTSQHVDVYRQDPMDQVITVCDAASKKCPVLPGAARHHHWSFEDPASATGNEEERLNCFRRVRDEIEEKIRQLLE
jgi:arsenate reductase